MGCQRPKPLAFTRRNLKNYKNIETQADKSDNFCMDASKAARLKEVAEMGTDAIPTKRTRDLKVFFQLHLKAFEATHVKSIQENMNNRLITPQMSQVC